MAIGTGIGVPFGVKFSWSSYWAQRYISVLTAQATSATEYTITATIVGTGQDGMSVEYSSDMGATWTVKGISANSTYSATGMTPGTLYQWRARLYKGTNYGSYVNAINYLLAGVDEPSLTLPADGSFGITNANDLNFFDGAGNDQPFYVSFWAKVGAGNMIFATKAKEWKIEILSGRIKVYMYSETNTTVYIGQQTVNTQQAAIQGAWHHICFYYDGSKSVNGLYLFVDKVEKGADTVVGTYVNMSYYTQTITSSAIGCEISDFKIGSGVLTSQNIIDLYDHKLLGTEIIHFPCTEGYGNILHNVTDQNLEKHATIAGTLTNIWANTQNLWKYNYSYGGTKVDDYFFPNLSSKAQSYTPIRALIQAGQSNASGAGVNAELTGTDYAAMTNAALRLAHIYTGASGNRFYKYDFPNQFTVVSIDDIVGYINNSESKDTVFIKLSEGGSGLAEGSSLTDWNPNTVGEHFDILAALIVADMTMLFKLGREPHIQAFIWVQGEQDAGTEAWANAYYANLVAFFDKWRTLINTPFKPEIIQLSAVNFTAGNGPIIRAAQAAYAIYDSLADVIDNSDATFNDGTHYDTACLIRLGERINNNIGSMAFGTPDESYVTKILPGFNKLYYTAHP